MPHPTPTRSRLSRLLAQAAVALTLLTGGLALPDAAQAQGYGAIAYSPATGQWGWSRGYRTRAQAYTRAMNECRARGRGCQVVVQVQHACASLATGPRGWGAGWGYTLARANAEALGACRRHSRNCSVRVNFCSN